MCVGKGRKEGREGNGRASARVFRQGKGRKGRELPENSGRMGVGLAMCPA